jgi:hypothetical protein
MIGRSIERRIVMNDDHTVAREMDVELEPVRSQRKSVIERRDGVLGPQRGPTPMSEYLWTPEAQRRMRSRHWFESYPQPHPSTPSRSVNLTST